ncbi:hypothetical protein [Dactylosporangium salmoneum]|uniref:hypothetical protein n=1 Tax=Dactylosporangium salmoneum TaxID=53361 RepID=UPI0031DC5939
MWSGIIMRRRATNGGTAAEITAETLEGWLARQEIQADLTFSNVDKFDIVRGLVAHVAAQAGGNMRLDTGANTAGFGDTISYLGKDSTKLADAISKLAEPTPGFEYTVTWTRSAGVFTPHLALATPALSAAVDPIVLEYPGSLTDYDYPEDGANAPNVVTAVGSEMVGVPLIARVEDTTGELAAGVPRFPGQLAAKDETDWVRLNARATTALQAGLADSVVPTAELRGDADPSFGSFPIGVAVRLRATSLYHPAGVNGRPGLDVVRRVTGWTVTPGRGEKVTLALGAATGKVAVPPSQRDVATYLRELDRRMRSVETRM